MFEGKLKKVCKIKLDFFCSSGLFKKLVTQKLLNIERPDIASLKAYQVLYSLLNGTKVKAIKQQISYIKSKFKKK